MPGTIQPFENAHAGSEPTNQAAKRERSSEDDEEGSRRVARLTDNNSATLCMSCMEEPWNVNKGGVVKALKNL